MAEKQRATELARSRQRVQQLQSDLPAIIQDQVGEHMRKLEAKLIHEFKDMGQRALEESTAVLNDQLGDRIQTLERVSSMQSSTLLSLRDSSRIAEQKVSSVVNTIERSLATAVPGFKLDPPSVPPAPAPYVHNQFRLENPGQNVVKAGGRAVTEVEDLKSKYGFCPNCTSNNVRRANRSGLFEDFLRLFFIAPFRCRACRHKFYRF
jgi:hypothetical protein